MPLENGVKLSADEQLSCLDIFGGRALFAVNHYFSVSDGKGGVVAQESTGQVYSIWRNGIEINRTSIDVPPNPTSLFAGGSSAIYAYYEGKAGNVGDLYCVEW
jgi:hypothetical protein